MRENLEPYEARFDFSVLVGCYLEEQSIEEFHSRLSKTLESMGRSYEIIFINDGSTDRTFEKLKAIYDSDRNVTAIVDLFKNVGQANAKTPGVILARGKAIVLIDSDLQLAPEDLPTLVARFDEGYDLVSGFRENRKDPFFRLLPSKLANMIMRKASGTKLKDFGCTFKIYDGRLVRAFRFDPFKPWRPIPVIAQARRIAEVPVRHYPRKYGRSGWTFRKLFAYNMENIVNLSQRPFQMMGAACLILSLVFLLRIVLAWSFTFTLVPQVTTGLILNVLVVFFLVLLAVLCAIGEFVIRNFGILQRKPAFVIREICRKADT